MLTRSTFLSAAAAGAATVSLPGGASAADLETVRVGRAVNNAFVFTFLEIGQDAKIWDQVGLKLDIASFRGDAQVQQGMTAGSLDFGLGSGPAMGYHAKGVPALAVAVMYGAPSDMAMVVGPNVKSIADLKGKKVGVTTAGSLTDWLVHETARRQGWGPDGIVSAPMGAMETRVAAMQAGEIAGTVQDIGIGFQLEEAGKGKVLTTFGPSAPKFITHAIFARDELVASKPDTVKKFLVGWFRTVAYAKSHRKEAIASSQRVLKETDGVMGKLYDTCMPGMSTNGAFDPAAVEVVRHSLKDLGIMDTEPPAKDMYTSKFVPVSI